MLHRCESEAPSELLLKHIRPRAYRKLSLKDLQPGDIIMANYNLEDPDERGHWFDCKVSTDDGISPCSDSDWVFPTPNLDKGSKVQSFKLKLHVTGSAGILFI